MNYYAEGVMNYYVCAAWEDKLMRLGFGTRASAYVGHAPTMIGARRIAKRVLRELANKSGAEVVIFRCGQALERLVTADHARTPDHDEDSDG